MRLTRQIFLWISLAVLLPLLILLTLATVWTENLYRAQIAGEINDELSQWVAEIDRKRSFDREMITALANTPELNNYLPVLEATLNDEIHPQYFERSETLARFLEGFSAAIPSLSGLRVLDVEGNSVIRIRFIAGDPAWDPELDVGDSELAEQLDQLPAGEVSYLTHPDLHDDFAQPALQDAVYPLESQGRRVGYLAAIPNGGDIDRVLDFNARPHGGHIFVFELNAENVLRDGMLLYDDVRGARMAMPNFSASGRIEQDERLRSEAQTDAFGHYVADAEPRMVFFQEYHPYPRRFISWVVGVRIDSRGLAEPFRRIQIGIVSVVAIALLAILLLVRLITKKIARPIESIAAALTDFAQSGRQRQLRLDGPEEIRSLQRSYNRMSDQLARARSDRDRAQEAAHQNAKLASIGQIAAGIGHELNNPLNHILGLTKLIERSVPSQEATLIEDVRSIREEAQRASRIVAGVLEFARQREINAVYFEAAGWLNRCVQTVRSKGEAKAITMPIDCGTEELYGDPDQLQQVMVNLLDNAIHASPEGAEVRISLGSDDATACIRVIDAGRGIPAEDQGRVFDPFYTTKSVGEGTGLGLSISLGIVEQHGGSLVLEAVETGGTEARIRLPVMEPAP